MCDAFSESCCCCWHIPSKTPTEVQTPRWKKSKIQIESDGNFYIFQMLNSVGSDTKTQAKHTSISTVELRNLQLAKNGDKALSSDLQKRVLAFARYIYTCFVYEFMMTTFFISLSIFLLIFFLHLLNFFVWAFGIFFGAHKLIWRSRRLGRRVCLYEYPYL